MIARLVAMQSVIRFAHHRYRSTYRTENNARQGSVHFIYFDARFYGGERITRWIVVIATKSETGDKKVSLDGEEAKQKKRDDRRNFDLDQREFHFLLSIATSIKTKYTFILSLSLWPPAIASLEWKYANKLAIILRLKLIGRLYRR